MKIEVPLHEKSEKEIVKIFSSYTETEEFPDEIEGRVVIHVYPKSDTWNSEGELKGYFDSLNCDLHIYDVRNATVYKTLYHDEIVINVPCQVRIFKDLSTMIIIDGGVHLYGGKSFLIGRL